MKNTINNNNKISKSNTLSKSKKTITIINLVVIVFFCLFLLGYGIIYTSTKEGLSSFVIRSIALIFCYLIPILLQLIFKTRLSPSLVLFYLTYLSLAGFGGSLFGAYAYIPNGDKIIHFIWGYVACFIGLYLLCKTGDIDNIKPFTFIVVVFSLSLATASIWEVIEFASDVFFDMSSQGVRINGVTPLDDTMIDTICHLGGTIIFLLHYVLEKIFHKNLGITSIIKDFKTKY